MLILDHREVDRGIIPDGYIKVEYPDGYILYRDGWRHCASGPAVITLLTGRSEYWLNGIHFTDFDEWDKCAEAWRKEELQDELIGRIV